MEEWRSVETHPVEATSIEHKSLIPGEFDGATALTHSKMPIRDGKAHVSRMF
jgi:hypothetical protein